MGAEEEEAEEEEDEADEVEVGDGGTPSPAFEGVLPSEAASKASLSDPKSPHK